PQTVIQKTGAGDALRPSPMLFGLLDAGSGDAERFVELRRIAAALRELGAAAALACNDLQRLLQELVHRRAVGAARPRETQMSASVLDGRDERDRAAFGDGCRDRACQRGALHFGNDRRTARGELRRLQPRYFSFQRLGGLAPRDGVVGGPSCCFRQLAHGALQRLGGAGEPLSLLGDKSNDALTA